MRISEPAGPKVLRTEKKTETGVDHPRTVTERVSERNHRNTTVKAMAAILLAVLTPASRTLAQHAADNPVLTAEDAFGFTLGPETIGIYSPGSVRGFSPQAAGNARIDGLYFDQQGALSQRVIEGSTIRVGLSEIGYAFPAPTGIVDYDLRHTGNGTPSASVITTVGPFETRGVSVDGSLPALPGQVELPMGASYQVKAGNPGYTSTVANVGVVPKWTPNSRWTFRALFDWQETTDARTLPTVFTQGDFLPPVIERGYYGQNWAAGQSFTRNYGLTAHGRLTLHWSLAAGAFRSIADTPKSYADLYLNTQLTGSAEHLLVSSPDQRTASTSGEMRLTGHFTEGARYHEIVFLVRGRNVSGVYGGSDPVDVGSAFINERVQVPMPSFTYSAPASEHTRLWSSGIAYHGRWLRYAELSLGMQRESYEKTVNSPGLPPPRLADAPWRGYGNLAVPITARAKAYAGYTQGLEDSGVAPNTAQNRGAILPAARTWQADAGLRYQLTSRLKLVGGVFELDKPYFNLDTNSVDRSLGAQRAKGFEFSASGELTKNFNVVAGTVLGHVTVVGPNLQAQGVGTAAFGQPHTIIVVNANYNLPELPMWSVDFGVTHWSASPASINDAVDAPPFTFANVGARCRFHILNAPATLRLQVSNVTNANTWSIGYSPGFFQYPPRAYLGYITVDL